ncbi:hypothetical protein [Brachybacterium sp. FME24]|uniref:hypothetical protein n=1 Tax=Brachybacterium sp. FME24 TaxID=2742605 RepID=UPI001866908E|nr:hypothetical protein [Brachybacterium sp. FME24]
MSSSTISASSRADAPEDYPWTGQAVRSALLLAEGIVDLDPPGGVEAPTQDRSGTVVDVAAIDQALAAEGAAPLAERTLVIAVGSNQTPETIARKYTRSGRDLQITTPFVRCTVRNLAVGHCAHTSARGYIPAAPYRADGERMELVATWFDDAQLAVVDETEPNYERVRLDAGEFPLALGTGEHPAHFDVYASSWGVVAREQAIPLRHRQQEMFDELVGLTGAELLIGDAAEICARLAAAPDALNTLVRGHGLVVEDGLARSSPTGPGLIPR